MRSLRQALLAASSPARWLSTDAQPLTRGDCYIEVSLHWRLPPTQHPTAQQVGPPLLGAELGGARALPQIAPFELGPEQAKERFLRWQRDNRLAPGSLLREGTTTLRAVLLPFWLFSAAVQAEYAGAVATAGRSGRQGAAAR